MKINIIRGQNQIGGSIIEIATNTTRIILDAGINLGESKAHPYVPSVPGLFADKSAASGLFADKSAASDCSACPPTYDAVFVSHYHSDHTGLLKYVNQKTPIFMGETAFKIVQTVANFKGKELGFSVNNYLENLIPVTIGDITVTPISCDHSAYDAFMFLIQTSKHSYDHSKGKSVLYTADYRSTGRKDFQKLLDSLPLVDVLITEGTTLSRGEDFHEPSEQALEDFAVELLTPRSGPAFIYLSAQNVDRITTAYCIAKRTNRRFIMDSLSSEVMRAAGLNLEEAVVDSSFDRAVVDSSVDRAVIDSSVDRAVVDSSFDRAVIDSSVDRAVIDSSFDRAVVDSSVDREEENFEEAEVLASPDFLLCVTPQSLSNIIKLNRHISFADGTLFFARREVYMLKPVTAALLSLLKSKGLIVSLLHTSGHADSATIQQLIHTVNPSIIIPIHTENAAWFSKYEDTRKVVYECKDFEV